MASGRTAPFPGARSASAEARCTETLPGNRSDWEGAVAPGPCRAGAPSNRPAGVSAARPQDFPHPGPASDRSFFPRPVRSQGGVARNRSAPAQLPFGLFRDRLSCKIVRAAHFPAAKDGGFPLMAGGPHAWTAPPFLCRRPARPSPWRTPPGSGICRANPRYASLRNALRRSLARLEIRCARKCEGRSIGPRTPAVKRKCSPQNRPEGEADMVGGQSCETGQAAGCDVSGTGCTMPG
jgi:hypothetical protein